MNLLIVESGAKSKTIQKYLGKEYVVMACGGHVEDLPQSRNATWSYEEGELPKPPWGWTKGAERIAVSYTHLTLPTILRV